MTNIKTTLKTNTFWEHHQRAILETFDQSDGKKTNMKTNTKKDNDKKYVSCDVLSWFRLIMVSLIIIWCYSPITPFSGPSQRSWPSLFTFGGCLSSFKFLISFFTLIDLYTIYIYSASLILIGGTIENIHLNFPNSEGGGNPIWKISKKGVSLPEPLFFTLYSQAPMSVKMSANLIITMLIKTLEQW